jgi:hypothetical protein
MKYWNSLILKQQSICEDNNFMYKNDIILMDLIKDNNLFVTKKQMHLATLLNIKAWIFGHINSLTTSIVSESAISEYSRFRFLIKGNTVYTFDLSELE